MPAPGTNTKMPDTRYNVTGFFRRAAKKREIMVRRNVAAREAVTVPNPNSQSIRYVIQLIPPAKALNISWFFGAQKITAKAAVADMARINCKIITVVHPLE